MNGIELRKKVAALKAKNAADKERAEAKGVLDIIGRTTPGGIRKTSKLKLAIIVVAVLLAVTLIVTVTLSQQVL